MLSKKLSIKPGQKFVLINAPKGFDKVLGALPANVRMEKNLSRETDIVLLFVTMKKDLEKAWSKVMQAISEKVVLWIAYPKKSSGIPSDLAMMSGSWEVYENSPWQPVAMISIDDTWTAVRFRFAPTIEEDRKQRASENILDSDGTVCVDKKNRVVTPSKDLQQLLHKNREANSFFETLSFTNKKEYVVWVISSKREETRKQRLHQAVEKLLKGRKNPSEK
jgi:hypothetical protein